MIVFADMDGTFLDPQKRVTDLAWQALDALARQGMEFVPCTGRPLRGVFPQILQHPSVHYVVSANGATVSKLSGAYPANTDEAQTLMSRPLDRAAALAVYDVAKDYDVTFDVFADGECYLERSLYDRLDEYAGGDAAIAKSLKDTRVPLDETGDATIGKVEMLERVAMYWHDPADRDAILPRLQQIEGIDITRSYPMNIEVMAAGTNKGTALAWLCDYLGIPLAEAYGFGDNINDIEMVELAGTGVAVQNAEPEVRAAAGAVCPGNAEDGVAKTILQNL